jgi:hypothetical protein
MLPPCRAPVMATNILYSQTYSFATQGERRVAGPMDSNDYGTVGGRSLIPPDRVVFLAAH